jgi:hypothetical protein
MAGAHDYYFELFGELHERLSERDSRKYLKPVAASF